jgi:DNA-binding transcriptional ArsR family regulator
MATGTLLSYMAKQNPDLSPLFHALADGTRRGILSALAHGPMTVSALAQPTGLRLPTVMRHLDVLETVGLIATTKDGRVRSCALVPAALTPMQGWIADQRAVWDGRLDRLEDYVMNVMEKQNDPTRRL